MIVRAWLVVGTVVIGVAWYLTVMAPPPTTQAAAQSPIESYRQAGLLPAADDWKLSADIGHDIFELPLTDAEHLQEELAAQMTGMPGMNMGIAQPDDEAAPMADMAMDQPGEQPAMQMAEDSPAPMAGMAMDQPDEQPAMQMADESAAPMPMEATGGGNDQTMPGMDMAAAPDAADGAAPAMAMDQPAEQAAQMPGMDMATAPDAADSEAPAMAMAQPTEQAEQMPGMAMTEEAEEGHGGGAGIELIATGSTTPITRTIELRMTEWGYSASSIMVEPGEVIRFVVTNGGNIPHEFMLMTPPGMASVGYRIQRADWNLTEHEAIFENPLVMPGDTFETVLKIEQPGAWMFMCMFPFHMQMGMMGVMMTEGMDMGAMQMEM